jgi:hypothetical protein
MKKYLFLTILFFSLGILTLAEDDPFSKLTYPIAELGNCQNRGECESFCDKPTNRATCLDFAQNHNLIPAEELALARKMLAVGEVAGPGNCQGENECRAYCDDINHLEECLAFGEKHGLIPPEELAEAKKVATAIKQGIKPPNCKNKTDCDLYCSQANNFEECLEFGKAAGLIPPEELEDVEKTLQAVKKGVKPPACRGKAECDSYCSQDEHFEECLTFAEAAGFLPPEEAAMARRTGGKGPGGCRGKEACEAFCEDPNNAEACVDFAVQYGFMPPEEAENAKKMMKLGIKGGPGNCQGKEACEAYCNDFSHLVECVDFAERAGFMSAEDAARARKMAERGVNVMEGGPGGCKSEDECRAFCEKPENSQTCLDFSVRIGEMTPEQAEQAKKGRQTMEQGGPGGCRGEEECQTYCQQPEHGRECVIFSRDQGFMPAEEAERMLQMMDQQQRQLPMMPEQFPSQSEQPMMPPEEMRQSSTPEEMERMMQEMPPLPPSTEEPPPTEIPPQSMLDQAKTLLANLLFLLGKIEK